MNIDNYIPEEIAKKRLVASLMQLTIKWMTITFILGTIVGFILRGLIH